MSESKAARNNNLSAMVNILNMVLFFRLLIWLFGFAPFLNGSWSPYFFDKQQYWVIV
jgi:hypothetical protein